MSIAQKLGRFIGGTAGFTVDTTVKATRLATKAAVVAAKATAHGAAVAASTTWNGTGNFVSGIKQGWSGEAATEVGKSEELFGLIFSKVRLTKPELTDEEAAKLSHELFEGVLALTDRVHVDFAEGITPEEFASEVDAAFTDEGDAPFSEPVVEGFYEEPTIPAPKKLRKINIEVTNAD